MIDELIARARNDGRGVLDEVSSKELVASFGIPTVPTRRADSASRAAVTASQLGFPAAIKVLSPDLVHKSDRGGVRLALGDEMEVAAAFHELREKVAAADPPIRFEGVAVQPMAPPGLELLLGGRRDPTFGPVVTVGLGGVMVELLDDLALRVAPVTQSDAEEMLNDIRARRLLDGFRGGAAIDRAPIREALVRLSEAMLTLRDVAEIDVNPVFAYPTGILAVDARVVLAEIDPSPVAHRSAPEGSRVEDPIAPDPR